MKTVTMHEAKTHLSRLVREAVEGEEIVIARGKVPLVRLVPLAGCPGRRTLGTARDLIAVSEDFDEPIEDFRDYG